MEEALPSLSSGEVGSRFVSENDIETAKAKRDRQWKAAYERSTPSRLGQEPPPRPAEDIYDGRSLAEKLAANRAAKQEEWEEKTKLANQFRALEDDEVKFLDSVLNEQKEEERKRQRQDAEEIQSFKKAVAARQTSSQKPDLPSYATTSQSKSTTAKASIAISGKKTQKANLLKGVVVKKKPTSPGSKQPEDIASQGSTKRRKVNE